MTNRLVDPLRLERPHAFEWPDGDDRKPAPREQGSRKKRATSISALLVMLLAALVMIPTAFADDDDDDDGDDGPSCVVGSAHGDFGTMFLGADQHLVFTACDNGPNSADTGSATYTNFTANPDFTYTAQLVCVNVTGSTARFGYVIPPGTSMPGLTGWHVVWGVTDSGQPNGQGDTAGFVAGPPLSGLSQMCDTVTPGQQAITSGDIVVEQAGGGGGDDDDDDDDDDDGDD